MAILNLIVTNRARKAFIAMTSSRINPGSVTAVVPCTSFDDRANYRDVAVGLAGDVGVRVNPADVQFVVLQDFEDADGRTQRQLFYKVESSDAVPFAMSHGEYLSVGWVLYNDIVRYIASGDGSWKLPLGLDDALKTVFAKADDGDAQLKKRTTIEPSGEVSDVSGHPMTLPQSLPY